jgi:IclR family KDG regulon transcriptional repressor
MPQGTPIVSSVKRALTIIETLAASGRGMSISALSRRLNLPKSTAHTIVLTLRSAGYVRCDDETGRYRIGPAFLEVAGGMMKQPDLHDEDIRYELRRVTEQTGLSAHCAVLENGQAVYVGKVETPGMIKLATWVGRRMEAHCTAVGKAMLAYLPSDELDAFLKQRRLPRHTENTIHSHEALRQELKNIRSRGYSYENEEFGLGMRCVGAPVFNREGKAIAAVSASGTTGQIHEQNIDSIQRIVRDAAKTISRSLGYAS